MRVTNRKYYLLLYEISKLLCKFNQEKKNNVTNENQNPKYLNLNKGRCKVSIPKKKILMKPS